MLINNRGREADLVQEETVEIISTPEACEETTEYYNRIEDDIEIEPEEEEQEEAHSHNNREEIEQQFARYERNFRARRIRELCVAPLKKTRGRKAGNTSERVAA